MKVPLKQIQHNQTFVLPGEMGLKRLSLLKGVKHTAKGENLVYCCPYEAGRLYDTRGYWVDWETIATIQENN